MNEGRPEGRLAVVVGATGTIGGAIVRRLVARGIPVLAVARGEAGLDRLRAESGLVSACVADIGDNAAIERIGASIDQPVRMAVLAAGLPVRGSVETIDPDALALGCNIKVGGVLRLVRAVGDRWGRGARLVTFAGTYGLEPRPQEPGPGAVNAAVLNLMRQLSQVYGPRGVTTHTISSGPTDSPRLRRIATVVAEERGVPFDEVWREYQARNSLGRLPTVDEVAWAVTMLLEPEAEAMHGGVLHMDAGGLHGAG